MELRVCLKFHQHYHSEQYEEFESHLQILRKVQDDIKNDSQ